MILQRKGAISKKEMNFFFYEAINLGKLYFLPNIHEKLFNVP